MHSLQVLASTTACLLLCFAESSPVRSAREVLRTIGQATAAKTPPSTSVKGETRPVIDNDIERQDSLPAALKAASPSCFGYGHNRLEGVWSAKGSWSPSTNSSCDLNEYWDFFEDSGTVRAVARCWERRRWVVFVGDSNSRKMYFIMLDRLKGLNFKYSYLSGNVQNLFGDNRWSDKDAIVYDSSKGKTKVLFRLSFRFYRGYEEFKQHWKNWNQLYESDGRINDLQVKEPFLSKLNAFRKMYQATSPDTIVFSSGLWKLDCNAASMAYKNLMSEMNANGVNDILFFTPGHLKYHPSITNNAVRKVRDCIVATRDKELYDLHSSSTPIPIFDVFELTQNLPDYSWVGYGGGYHYVSDYGKPSPVAKAVVAAWNSFVCD